MLMYVCAQCSLLGWAELYWATTRCCQRPKSESGSGSDDVAVASTTTGTAILRIVFVFSFDGFLCDVQVSDTKSEMRSEDIFHLSNWAWSYLYIFLVTEFI